MTKKDYKIIARGIYQTELDNNDRANIALELGAELKRDNPEFDMTKFREACGVDYE